MRALILVVAAACCAASPVMYVPSAYGTSRSQPWTTYTTQSQGPAVVRIPEPGLKLSLPRITTHLIQNPVAPIPVVKTATPVVAPVPVVKAIAPVAAASPVVVAAAAPEPLLAPEPPMPSVGKPFVGGQFHAQDEAGQYSFGHWGGPNTRVENRDFLGRTSGSFAYVDPEGDVQMRKYAAASGVGFRVAASDLPVDTPTVAQVKAAHANAHADVRAMSRPTSA
ncbi:uncharacterized protein [Panulirus ornatus]|uniref:uncharacterized protein n=1 Tax=Panulirus ornatus TaxID=150431 RepID=UPI003A892A13